MMYCKRNDAVKVKFLFIDYARCGKLLYLKLFDRYAYRRIGNNFIIGNKA